jgi:hypothetical protein
MLANLARPVLTENAGKFRSQLSIDQCAFIEATCGTLMPHFGYTPIMPPADPELLWPELQKAESWDKPGYTTLAAEERARFEAWSTLVARLRAA